MLKRLVSLGLSLTLAGVLGATPVRRAMVLSVQGEVSSSNQPVLAGQLLDDSNLLVLKKDSKVTLLLLNKGQRLAVTGQGKLEVGSDGVRASDGARVTVVDSNQQKLALNGENHRTLGGITMRAVELASQDLVSTPFDRVEVREGQGLVVSRPAGSGVPPSLDFSYAIPYRMPRLAADGKAVATLPSSDQKIWSATIAGQQVGSRWQWEIDWPKENQYKSMGLLVTEADERPLLYTWVYQTSPQDEAELRSLARGLEDWKVREPESLEPFVLYSTLLEDRGCLEQANQQLDRALTLKKSEPGLLDMKVRILTELGRYSEASQVFHHD